MNRKRISYILTLLLLTFIYFLITNNKVVLVSVNFSISIWKDNLFPTLFPFLVISSILIKIGSLEIIGNIIGKPISKIFKISKEGSCVLISSLITGFPSGAKLTSDLYRNRIIDLKEANKLIMFTSFSSPMFIIGFIYSLIPINKIIYIILISHTLAGLLVGIIFRNSVELNNTPKQIKKEDNSSFSLIFKNSIIDSLNTMFLLLGIVTIFSLVVSFFEITFNFNLLTKTIISGLLEMTQGIKNISILNISLLFKTILITSFISFGGLSIHMQVLSIISDTKIKYKQFLLARIIHTILASLLVLIFYYLH